MPDNRQRIAKEIVARRKYGLTTCLVVHRDRALETQGMAVQGILDAFVGTIGFRGLGDAWAEISLADCKTIIKEVLHKGLAYGVPMMSEDEARGLVENFLSLFGERTRYFTNGNTVLPAADPRIVPGADNPITNSTFDTGVVCLDDTQIGILWVEDED